MDVRDDGEPHAEIVGDRGRRSRVAGRRRAALADRRPGALARGRGSSRGLPGRVPRAQRAVRPVPPRELGARDARAACGARRVRAACAAVPRAGDRGRRRARPGTLAAVWLAGLPFVLAAQWWRRRYGVSDADYVTMLVDPWLERLGGLAGAGIAIALVMLLARRLGDRWWLVGGPAFAAVAARPSCSPAVPARAALEPLRDRALAAEIGALARAPGRGEVDVEVRERAADARLNAEFYGIGPTKRIVLWDTTLERLTRPRSASSPPTSSATSTRTTSGRGSAGCCCSRYPARTDARVTRRRGGLGDPQAVPLALLAVAVLQLALLPVTNAISRRYEREADWLGLQATDEPRASARRPSADPPRGEARRRRSGSLARSRPVRRVGAPARPRERTRRPMDRIAARLRGASLRAGALRAGS